MTITVENLTKRFGDGKVAVNEVSFSVGDGELLVLVGSSGCGKTTTLRLLAGLEEATSGTIRVGDRTVNDVRPRDRNGAMMFQDYAIFPHFTVFENIAYGAKARRVPRAEIRERVPEVARMFRIDHLLDRKPRQISGGERQRVALARAMMRTADLYLYDEPLSNLDAQLRHQARDDILSLHRQQGKPTVYVTHDQSEAVAMGDRLAVMRDGQIEQIGSPQDLYARPRTAFVAFFIGTPSINFFDGKLTVDGDQVVTETELGRLVLPPELAAKAVGRAGSLIRLGIRPEDLHIPRQATFKVTESNTVRGVVSVIEPTAAGSTVWRAGPEGATDFVATFKARLPMSMSGRTIPLAVDLARAHLFDAGTEESVLYA